MNIITLTLPNSEWEIEETSSGWFAAWPTGSPSERMLFDSEREALYTLSQIDVARKKGGSNDLEG